MPASTAICSPATMAGSSGAGAMLPQRTNPDSSAPCRWAYAWVSTEPIEWPNTTTGSVPLSAMTSRAARRWRRDLLEPAWARARRHRARDRSDRVHGGRRRRPRSPGREHLGEAAIAARVLGGPVEHEHDGACLGGGEPPPVEHVDAVGSVSVSSSIDRTLTRGRSVHGTRVGRSADRHRQAVPATDGGGPRLDRPVEVDLPVREALQHLVERDPSFEASERSTEAEVQAVTERQVVVEQTVDVERVAVLELPVVRFAEPFSRSKALPSGTVWPWYSMSLAMYPDCTGDGASNRSTSSIVWGIRLRSSAICLR